MLIGQQVKSGSGSANNEMENEDCPFYEGVMVTILVSANYNRPKRLINRGLIIEVFPLLQVADILLVDGSIEKRVPFINIKILNEDVI